MCMFTYTTPTFITEVLCLVTPAHVYNYRMNTIDTVNSDSEGAEQGVVEEFKDSTVTLSLG